MLVQDNKNATLVNRINNILPDHVVWIKDQIRAGKFITTREREVFISVPNGNLKKIVNIPDKDDPNYKNAWVQVYNLALDYLEGALNLACLENKFIQKMGSGWSVNGHMIVWPKFNPANADYAKGLDNILGEYIFIKSKFLESLKAKKEELKVKKSSVSLRPITEVKISSDIKEDVPVVTASSDYKVYKVSDGDNLSSKDITGLKESNVDLVLVTCQNVLEPKEEDIFVRNEELCDFEGLKTGAYVYGKAKDETEAIIELKRMVKTLSRFKSNFTKFVVYSLNNSYIRSIQDSEMKMLEYMNAYTGMLNSLKECGYNVMISMNLESGKVINDINTRYNSGNDFPMCFVTVVRDLKRVPEGSSTVVVDPWNDYDIVSIKDRNVLNYLNSDSKERGLVRS